MKVENPNDYTFKGFEKSKTKNKKYDAILVHKQTKREKRVPFGDSRYDQYKDRALGHYKSKDHLDKKRRDAYRRRHSGELNNKFSSGYFAWKYLW